MAFGEPRAVGAGPAGTQRSQYRTLIADPPWSGQQGDIHSPPYRLLSVEELCALPVTELAATNVHVVMEDWGFSYRCCLTWIRQCYGMGQHLELLARRRRSGWDVCGDEVACDVLLPRANG